METESEKDAVKSERFRRLAKYRVNKVLDGYRLLARMTGYNYKSSPTQRNEMLQALKEGLEEMEYVWAGEKPKKEKFKFRDEAEDSDVSSSSSS